MNIEIIHRDEHLLVLNKPSGLATTAPDGGDCLMRRAQKLDDSPFLHATSRLDLPVSGLVTLVRTRQANEALMDARARGAYRRLYLGLSAPVESLGSPWAEPLGLDPHDPKRRRVYINGAPKNARCQDARTHARIAASSELGSLLHLVPKTGRTHQLRVHAAHHGAPLLGDTRYGGLARVTLSNGRVLAARRTMLHCSAVDLPQPDGEVLALRAPPPADFSSLWQALGGDLMALQVPKRLDE